jgi:antitoxin (DNA-binding transcriptional repressor) of toxin-antitoxin stability system
MEISLSELRSKMSSAMEAVKKGEQVFVTERGKVIAVMGPPLMNSPLKTPLTLESTKEAQRMRDLILKGVNRKS